MILRLFCIILLGALVMKVKYLVQAQNDELKASMIQIAAAEEELEVLEAEYVYLSRPNRILEYANKNDYAARPDQVQNLTEYLKTRDE